MLIFWTDVILESTPTRTLNVKSDTGSTAGECFEKDAIKSTNTLDIPHVSHVSDGQVAFLFGLVFALIQRRWKRRRVVRPFPRSLSLALPCCQSPLITHSEQCAQLHPVFSPSLRVQIQQSPMSLLLLCLCVSLALCWRVMFGNHAVSRP
jgi:hypothetical protein